MTTATAPPARKPMDTMTTIGLGFAALFVLWAIASLISDPRLFAQVIITGISNGALYALVALGYTMVYGIIELINFAHGDLFMMGSIIAASLLDNAFHQDKHSLTGWLLLLLVLVVTMAACALLNMLIERLAYRRLRNAPKLAPLITAVGVSYILQNIGILANRTSAQRSRPSVLPQGTIKIGSVEIAIKYLIVLALTIPLLFLMTWLVQKTKVGKAMRATAQDRDASRLMGIDVDRIISYTFGIGGALAGAAGLMFMQVNGSTSYALGFRFGLVSFTAAVIGGVGDLRGAVVGGFVIGIIYALTEGASLFPGSKWVQTMVFAILIMFVLFRPAGIFGKHETEKV